MHRTNGARDLGLPVESEDVVPVAAPTMMLRVCRSCARAGRSAKGIFDGPTELRPRIRGVIYSSNHRVGSARTSRAVTATVRDAPIVPVRAACYRGSDVPVEQVLSVSRALDCLEPRASSDKESRTHSPPASRGVFRCTALQPLIPDWKIPGWKFRERWRFPGNSQELPPPFQLSNGNHDTTK